MKVSRRPFSPLRMSFGSTSSDVKSVVMLPQEGRYVHTDVGDRTGPNLFLLQGVIGRHFDEQFCEAICKNLWKGTTLQ